MEAIYHYKFEDFNVRALFNDATECLYFDLQQVVNILESDDNHLANADIVRDGYSYVSLRQAQLLCILSDAPRADDFTHFIMYVMNDLLARRPRHKIYSAQYFQVPFKVALDTRTREYFIEWEPIKNILDLTDGGSGRSLVEIDGAKYLTLKEFKWACEEVSYPFEDGILQAVSYMLRR